MTCIQQIHWELEMDYIGHPYYVSGNAILHALGQQIPHEAHQQLHVSHGLFVPGQFGAFPKEHSQSRAHPYLGGGLPDVDAYDDLFLFRDPYHPWLLDARPRDALNTHGVRLQSGHPAIAHETIVGRPRAHKNDKKTTRWFVNAYVHADDPDVLPLGEDVLDGLQFGGKRNYGYGVTRIKETQTVDLEELDYSRLEAADEFSLKLMTPFVLETEYPRAHDQSIPCWWGKKRDGLREREEKIVEQRTDYRLQTVDHGQIVPYGGGRPIETAKNSILRVGSHTKCGFGELRIIPADRSRKHCQDLDGSTDQ